MSSSPRIHSNLLSRAVMLESISNNLFSLCLLQLLQIRSCRDRIPKVLTQNQNLELTVSYTLSKELVVCTLAKYISIMQLSISLFCNVFWLVIWTNSQIEVKRSVFLCLKLNFIFVKNKVGSLSQLGVTRFCQSH
jgi:hypothetical protein